MKENTSTKVKKPTIQTLELETYLANVQEKADKISDRFVGMFFILGLCLAPVYQTWSFTIANSVIIAVLYLIARKGLTNKFHARMIISLVYAIFMLQFIGQMHGMAEVHFFFFINIALLIIYQDWRIMIPYTIMAIGHHSVLAILQANAADFGLENSNLPNYFIGFGGRTMEGESVDYITTFQLMFHFGLAAMMAFICGWWAIIFRNNSIHLMEKQLETQAQNEELQSSEEELRQNSEELQATNDQMKIIQKEIEAINKALDQSAIISIADKEGIITKVNDEFCQISKYTREELIGKNHNIVNSELHPKEFWQTMWRDIARGKTWRAEIKNKAKDGSYYWVDTVINPILDENGKINSYLSIRNLITEKKESEIKIQEAYQKVQSSEEELRQNYEELQATQEQLELKNEKQRIFNDVLTSSLIEESSINAFLSSTVEYLSTATFLKLQPGIGIFIKREDGQFEMRVQKDISPKIQQLCAVIKEGQCLCGTAALTKKAQYANCVDARHTITFEGIKQHGHYNIPITNRENVLGILVVYLSHGHERNQDEISFLENICTMIAETLKRTEYRKTIETQNKNLQVSEEELKQNLEELQTTQEKVQLQKQELEAINAALDQSAIISIADKEGIILKVNDEFCQISKYTREELIGKNHSIVNSKTHSKEFWQAMWRDIARGKTWRAEIKNKAKDGSIYWVDTVINPIFDANGKISSYLSIRNLITEKKENEQKIQEAYKQVQTSQEELKLNLEELQTTQEKVQLQKQELEAINAALDQSAIISIADKEGIILKVNDEFCQISKYTREELIGKNHSIVNSKTHSKEFWQAMWRTIARGKTWRAEIKNKAKDGSIYWVDTVINPIFDANGKISSYLSIRNLITEKKENEQKIQEAYKQVQASEKELQQNYKDLQTTQELLQEQKEKIEKSFVELQTTQNQLIQSEKMASLGQLVANIAHEINTPLGAIRSSAISIEDILSETLSTLPSFLKSLDDVTLHNFNEFVKQSSQKTDTLSSREKRAIKYELIDELETTKIQNAEEYADWIVDMNMYNEKEIYFPLLKPTNSKEIFQIAYQLSTIIRSNQTVKTATDRAAKIVFALKNFARQDQTGAKSMVNINESIETTLTLYHNQIKHGIDVTRDLSEIPEFMGYPDELIQVWTNIIHNAIQAMKNKGRLFIQTSVENEKVLVAIQDNGNGIPKEVQERVFDAFFTTKAVGEGSGLGLDITKKIIEKHNGKIWFQSLEGIGTTFFIQLPLN